MSWRELKLKWEQQPEYREALEQELPFADVADAVIGLRVEHGLTQRELADLADTTQSVISRMESGHHSFEIALLTRISKALDVKWRPVFESSPAGAARDLVVGNSPEGRGAYRIHVPSHAVVPFVVYTTEQPDFVRADPIASNVGPVTKEARSA